MIVHRILDERFAVETADRRVTEVHVSPHVARTILMESDPVNAMDFGLKLTCREAPHVAGVDWFEDPDMTGETWRFVTEARGRLQSPDQVCSTESSK